MLIFPNAKINLGLNVTEKRKDGFHNIETIFYPIDWCDALEVIETKNKDLPFEMSMSGLSVLGDVKSNLIYKAWEQLAQLKNIPPLSVHLHKHIPMGAGLGGGSADAAFFLNLMNSQFDLNLTETTLISIANSLGSDCAFFLKNQPVIATQKGNVFSEIKIDLSKYFILIVFPSIHSNTKDAYDGITPQFPIIKLEEIIETDSIPSALDVAAILCHDVIEDCPDFQEVLYKYSRELFWEVATQSEISKPEVLTYLTQKKSEETLTTLIHPSVSYLLRLTDDVNLLMQRIAALTGHIFYDPSFASRFPT